MIELRDIVEDDAERLFLWRREPEVDRWMCGEPPRTLDGHLAWFHGLRDDRDTRAWVITLRSRPVGLLTLKGLTGFDRRAEWGWYVGEPEARGRGVGRGAQALGLDQAFGSLGLHKVWADVLADNETALKAQLAAGFRREGYLVEHAYKGGEFRDVVRLAILAPEWAERRDGVVRPLTQSHMIAA